MTNELAISALMSGVVQAQQAGKDVYADPQNLKVLPEDISPRELGDTMKGFALGLGARRHTGAARRTERVLLRQPQL